MDFTINANTDNGAFLRFVTPLKYGADNAYTSTIEVAQTPDDLTAEQAGYISRYPKLEINNGTTKLIWTRGDANYTSQPIEAFRLELASTRL